MAKSTLKAKWLAEILRFVLHKSVSSLVLIRNISSLTFACTGSCNYMQWNKHVLKMSAALCFHAALEELLSCNMSYSALNKGVLGELWIAPANEIALSDKWSFHCLTSQGCVSAPKTLVSMAIACAECFKKLLSTLEWQNWQQSCASAATGALIAASWFGRIKKIRAFRCFSFQFNSKEMF